ncbi:hypothetical protein [Jiella sp. M17.18]|uniref:hypothetical protein n=1 Tax=Jiella sp. M17.18 TaxID=3234247 RepID=UPI0034DEE5DA
MAKVEIEALRPFNRHAHGDPCEVGDRFTVSAARADELERLNLARRTAAAPKPENKMLPDPPTKRAASTRRSNPEKD